MENKNILRACLLQTDLVWEDRSANIEKFDILFDNIKQQQDIIVLPEMFTTGFSMNAIGFAEIEKGHTLEWLKDKAKVFDAMVTGSVIISEAGGYFNRLFAVFPDGNYEVYNKRHLFRMAGESDIYSPGQKTLIINFRGWKISPFICYDLRFPVWSRNKNEYDVYLNVANWPASRREIWMCLLKARAIENQAYVIGVNRIGQDINSTNHSGDSMIIAPQGQVISQAGQNKPDIIYAELSLSELNDFRKKFPVSLDADPFELGIRD